MLKTPDFNNILIWDTETTSIKPNYIVTIAFQYFENGKLIKKGYEYCNPDYPISPQASAVNGLYNEDVENCPTFDIIWKKIKPYFLNSMLCGQNLKFDLSALALEFERYGIEPFEYYYVDTLENAKKLIKKEDIANFKLGTLCEYFGINIEKFHDASFDVEATKKVYNKLVKLSNGDLIIRDHNNKIYIPEKEED